MDDAPAVRTSILSTAAKGFDAQLNYAERPLYGNG